MALRTVRKFGDEILEKKANPVRDNSKRIQDLIDDMFETMYDADGVGLAAPQVGILKRIVVIDVSEKRDTPLVLINPEVISTEGEQTGPEGCLSYPGKSGIVKRPAKVKFTAYDRDFKKYDMEAEGLLARAVMHETDHLEGHVYTEKVIGKVYDSGDEEAEHEAEVVAGMIPPDEENEEDDGKKKGRKRK